MTQILLDVPKTFLHTIHGVFTIMTKGLNSKLNINKNEPESSSKHFKVDFI